MGGSASSAPPRLLCLVSDAVPRLFGDDPAMALLAPNMLTRGIAVEPATPEALASDQIAAILLGPTPAVGDEQLIATARRLGAPVFLLGDSWTPNRLRLGELSREGGDARLSQLLDRWGRALHDVAVDAVAGLLPTPAIAFADPEDRVRRVALAPGLALPEEWAEVLVQRRLAEEAGRHGFEVVSSLAEPGAALLAPGAGPPAWAALLSGREVVCLGCSPFVGLGLTHDAARPEGLSPALASLAAGRRNRRDAARRALATEALFNSFLPDPAAVAGALDAAIRAVGRRPPTTVSIVVTNHNYSDYVGAAVESARHQTVPPCEIVVVDDGSTDGSAEVIAALPGIVPVLKANGGQASAMNAGLTRATGEVVLFLDADDRLLPEAVERIVQADLRGVSRLSFPLETIDSAGRATGLYDAGAPAPSGFLAGCLMVRGIFPFMPTSGNAFPRRALNAIFPLPEAEWRICADLYLVLAAASLGETVDLGVVLGQYRVHGRNKYFDCFVAAPHRADARLAQRLRAWRGLADRLPDGCPQALPDRLRLGFHRLTCAALANMVRQRKRGSIAALAREMGRAIRIALSGRSLPPSMRLGHAVLPLWSMVGALAGRTPGEGAPGPIARAGPATWPRLEPCTRLDLTAERMAGVVGSGWSPEPDGARLTHAEGALAFRLPEIGCDWRLQLDFAVAGEAALQGVEVGLNGAPIAILDLTRLGVLDLRLPAELLSRWDAIVPGALPGTAACLTLRTRAADANRLSLSTLRLDPDPAASAPAPYLPAGILAHLGADGGDWLRSLGSGWDWPDRGGVRLLAGRGRITLSLAGSGVSALTLILAGEAERPLRADHLQLIVNKILVDAHLTAHWTEGNRSLVTLVASLSCGVREGRLTADLCAFVDPETGAWPGIRLVALRLDRAADARGGPRLVANLPVAAGPVAGSPALASSGLVPDGDLAHITGKRFQLTLSAAAVTGPSRLVLRIVARGPLATPTPARLWLNGAAYCVLLGRDNSVMLDLPEADPSGRGLALRLEGAIESSVPCFALAALEIRSDPIGRSADPKGISHWPEPSGCLGPLDLLACATDPAAWHPPQDEATWLAVQRAELLLPPPPPGTGAVEVTVLALQGQRVEVAIGDSHAETDQPGMSTLRLALPVWSEPKALRLVVACTPLVAADTAGATAPAMLGGAVCRIALVAALAAEAAAQGGAGEDFEEGVVIPPTASVCG